MISYRTLGFLTGKWRPMLISSISKDKFLWPHANYYFHWSQSWEHDLSSRLGAACTSRPCCSAIPLAHRQCRSTRSSERAASKVEFPRNPTWAIWEPPYKHAPKICLDGFFSAHVRDKSQTIWLNGVISGVAESNPYSVLNAVGKESCIMNSLTEVLGSLSAVRSYHVAPDGLTNAAP